MTHALFVRTASRRCTRRAPDRCGAPTACRTLPTPRSAGLPACAWRCATCSLPAWPVNCCSSSRARFAWMLPLPFSVRDPQGKLLLAKGQVLTNDAQLQALLARGLYVDLDEVRAARARRQRHRPRAPRCSACGAIRLAPHRSPVARHRWRAWVRGARCTSSPAVHGPGAVRDPDIAIYPSMRQDPGPHQALRADACAACGDGGAPAGHAARLARAARRILVKAGLTMNLGIIDLQAGSPRWPPERGADDLDPCPPSAGRRGLCARKA